MGRSNCEANDYTPLYRRASLYVSRRAAKILVLADRFRGELVSVGIDREKVVVFTTMFDGVSCEQLRGNRKASVNSLLFLSRLVKEKDLRELLEAFQKLSEIYPKLRLVIAGEGSIQGDLQQWVVEKSLTSKVCFSGFVNGDEKINLLCDADLFVLPTYYGEGCPVALLEAMAAGLPVVTTRAGGIPDVVGEPENRILLDEVSADSIVAGVRRFIDEPELVWPVSKNNCDKAWSQFEASVVSKRLATLYRETSHHHSVLEI